MEFIVSSKYLAKVLSRIDFDDDVVNNMSYDATTEVLTLTTIHKKVEFQVTMLDKPLITELKQGNRRWDWLRKLCMSVEEQPIVIRASEMTLNITFQY